MGIKKATPQDACLAAAKDSRGIISVVADRLGLGRAAIYELMERYPAFKQAIYDEREKRKDRAELTLDSIIAGHWVTDPSGDPQKPTRVYIPPNVTGLIFFLKTQGRDRGYSEKLDINLGLSPDIVALIPQLQNAAKELGIPLADVLEATIAEMTKAKESGSE